MHKFQYLTSGDQGEIWQRDFGYVDRARCGSSNIPGLVNKPD